ncbi:hypothetical protein M422DRAFT_191224 [Sphaerobolus stellatus SS14]|uniref:AAA+ ATPase domain-containing protein n=1 Tax=Sphaerobolus stellatus (strain SS14) TaxID=990650 RepID=A0A0C9UPL2_SPHS4|nr:hypothetical protein M422DRAFT_191224 [Sphaerobolus stellatus SS14]
MWYVIFIGLYSTSAGPSPPWTPIPLPAPMFGRENEMENMLSHMKVNKPLRIAILGPGGMGKTTLALHFLHAQVVMEEYPSQLFISCEGRYSIDELLLDLAEQIRIPSEKRREYLQDQILEALRSPSTIICLDNLETLWESPELQPMMEDFLNHLSGIQTLGLIVTIRGNQRPYGVTWPQPLLKPLPALKIESSLKTFESIVGIQHDENVQRLLKGVEGIPLAITLISNLIRDETESPEALWSRWQKEKTKVLKTGQDRKSSLTISINLSFKSPRMTEDARELLHLLSFLPDGFSNANQMLEDIQRYIPQFRQALTVLKSVALVEIDQQLQRIHVLSPIKHLTLESGSCFKFQKLATEFFVDLLSKYQDKTSVEAHQIITPDFYNISYLLNGSYERGQLELDIIQATINWTKWAIYLGRPLDKLITHAIENADITDVKADCYSALGQICMHKNSVQNAEIAFQNALEHHRQAHNDFGQANDLQDLGKVYMHWDQLEEAEKSFQDALELHKQAQSVLGQANDLQDLGKVYMRRNQLEEAEKSFQDALELHKQAQDVLGQASDLRNLGGLYMRQDHLEEAGKSFQDALELHKQAQDILGQASDLWSLGGLYMHQDQLKEAEKSFQDALKLHKQAQHVLGQAYDLLNLGGLYMRRDQLEEAEKSFQDALELHKQAQSVLGQANDLQGLGKLYMHQNQLEEAEESFQDALELHKQAQDVLGQANDLRNLGGLYMHQDQLEEAEKSFQDALELHKQAHSVLGQANDLWNLGRMYMYQDQMEEAEKSLLDALELYKQAQSVLGQANTHYDLGRLYMHSDQNNQAENNLNTALAFYKQINMQIYEAYVLELLSQLEIHNRK